VNRRSVFYWILGILIAAIAILVAFHFDAAVKDFMLEHRGRTTWRFMHKVSWYGDWPLHFLLGLVLAGIAWLRGSDKWTRVFLAMLVALAIAGIIGHGIKITTGRARPSVKTEHVWNGPSLSSKYHAFPSGHVAASTAFFAVLFLVNWRIGIFCLPIPLLIGFARMYIAAHYLSDVVCAAVLGFLCALIAAHLFLLPLRTPQSALRN
jgi:membrane-associated phospholipid phosphatase